MNKRKNEDVARFAWRKGDVVILGKKPEKSDNPYQYLLGDLPKPRKRRRRKRSDRT